MPPAQTSNRFAHLAAILLPALAFALLMLLGWFVPGLRGVLDLSLPFFGLIGLGFVCGKLMRIPEDGLRWMNFFIVYVSLPVLFFNLVSQTPFEALSNGRFIFGTTVSTYIVFTLSLCVGMIASRGDLRAATVMGVAGAYSNVGYMGPGLTLAALGPQSAAPTALIFAFDSLLFFTLTPLFMALSGEEKTDWLSTATSVVKRVLTHPFNVATAAGACAAYWRFEPAPAIAKTLGLLQGAAAPSALFVLGVTIALRNVTRPGPETAVLIAIKLVLHPLVVWTVLSLLGDFGREWTFTAILMSALPQALNVFVLANQYQVYVERASTIVLAGTLASVVSLTMLLYLITTGRIPYRLFQP